MNTYLILDANNLCYRAYYALPQLSYKQMKTSVTYGFLGTILAAQGKFGTEKCLFAFDSRKNNRKELLPTYKAHRAERTPEQQVQFLKVVKQINKLRKHILPSVGFNNIFKQEGFEADDIIASLCQNLPSSKDKAIVVSTDSDLLQLISSNVTVYDPKRQISYTPEVFEKLYGIPPSKWVYVKAIAGCNSDGVKGIKGVGEKGAIQYLRGELKKESKKYASIVDGRKLKKANLKLVRLPLEGTKIFGLREDSPLNWDAVFSKYGIKSLKPKEIEYREKPRKKHAPTNSTRTRRTSKNLRSV